MDNQVTNDQTPTVTGKTDPAEAGRRVYVVITDEDGETVFEGWSNPVELDGTWSVDVTNELPEGEYTVDATYQDEAGNETTDTGELNIVLSDNTHVEEQLDDEDEKHEDSPIIDLENFDQPKVDPENPDGPPINGTIEIPADTTVEELLGHLKPRGDDDGEQKYEIRDSEGNLKDPQDPILPGDVLIVTAENGEDQGKYELIIVGIETPEVSAILSTDKEGYKPGETIVYSVKLENAGPRTIQTVVASAIIPEGTSYIPGSVKVGGVIVAEEHIDFITSTRELVIRLPDLLVGEAHNVQYSVEVADLPTAPYAGSMLTEQVRVTYRTVLNDVYQTISNEASTQVLASYALEFSPGQTKSVIPGSYVVFAHTIENRSNDGDSFLITTSGADDLDILWYYDLNGDGKLDQGDVSLESSDGAFLAGPLQAYDSYDLIMVVAVPEGSLERHEAIRIHVVSQKEPVVQKNVTDVVVINNAAPSLTITGPEIGVYAGDEFELEVTYQNDGTSDLDGATVTLTLDQNNTFIRASIPEAIYDLATHTVTVPVDKLAPGEEGTFKITVTTDETLVQGTILRNEAQMQVDTLVLIDAVSNLVVSNKYASYISIESQYEIIVGDGESTSIIRAYITDLLGNPVVGDDVWVTFTTADGKFVESDSKTAKVRVVDGEAFLTLQSPLIVSSKPVRIPVVVSAMNPDAGEVSERIDIIFTPGALTGRLINSQTGLPETGILVHLIKDDGIILETYTDEYGYYLFEVPAAGQYVVQFIYFDEDGEPLPPIGSISNVEQVGKGELSFGPRIVQGRIVDRQTGDGFAYIQVLLYDEDGKLIAETTTDANGYYVFRVDMSLEEQAASMQTFARAQTVEGSTSSWRVVAVTGLGHDLQRSLVPLKPGDILLNVGLFADSGGKVTNKVTGEPIQGAEAHLIHAGGPFKGQTVSLPLRHGLPQQNPALTDAKGIYRISVVPGSYLLVVGASGYHTLVTESFPASGEVQENVKLTPMAIGDLTIEKAASAEFVDQGGEVEFTLTLTNHTNFIVDNVVVTDTLPAGVSYMDGSGSEGVVHQDGVLTWTLTNVKPGKTELTYRVRVDADAKVGQVLTNNVEARMEGHDVPAEGSASFTVAAWPQMDLEIRADRTTAEVGDDVRYEVKVTNNPDADGAMVSKNTWIEVVLPKGFVYRQNTSKIDGVEVPDPIIEGNVLRWNVGVVSPGDEIRLTFTSSITVGAKEPDNITKAYVDGTSEADYFYRFGPAQTRLTLSRGIFGQRGTILGTVFLDENENGIQDAGEPGISGVELLFDNGYMVTTDQHGLYSIGNMMPGTRAMTVDSRSLPEGYQVAWGSAAKQHASKFITLNPMGLAVEHIPLVRRDDAKAETGVTISSGLAEVTVQMRPLKVSGVVSGYLEMTNGEDTTLKVRLDSRRQQGTDTELFADWSRGDASITRDLAPSSHALYALLTHANGQALYGDYSTGWSNPARYTNYQHKVTGLEVKHGAGFRGYLFAEGRDVHTESIAARGLAGLYYLAETEVFVGSEQVWLKSMATNSAGDLVEISRELLRRGLDYKMNYQLGSVLFTRPIPSLDHDLNEVWIEVSYATAGSNEKDYGYGLGMQFGENHRFGLTLVGGLASGGQGILVGVDGSYLQDQIALSYGGATNFRQGFALYAEATWQATEDLTVIAKAEHIGGEMHRAGQSTALAEGTEFSLGVDYALNEDLTLGAETKVRRAEDGKTTYTDQVKVAYHPETSLGGEAGLKSQGERFGFISQGRKLSAFSNVTWRPTEKLGLTVASSMAFPFSTKNWQLQFGSSYELSRQVRAEVGLKASMAELLQGKGNWVLGLAVTPEGWPDLYGQYRLPVGNQYQEIALGLRHAFMMENGILVRMNAEGTLRSRGNEPASTGYAVGLGLAHEANPAFRPSLQVEYANQDGKGKGRLALDVKGHSDPGLSYEASASWYFGQEQNASERDLLTKEFRGSLAYRNKEMSKHTILAQYLGRNYLLSVVEGFSAAQKLVHAASVEWGYIVNENLTITAQGAARFSSQKAEGERSSTSSIYLGQLGAEYRLHPDYTFGAFARLLRDNLGVQRGGIAVELGRMLNDDLMFSIGYSTLSLDDPDLSTLVDWPNALYLRLRMKF